MKKYILYLFAFLAMISTAMNAEPSKNTNVLQVEVLIFSGRPNPVFTISDPAQINEILGAINALPSEAEVATLKAAEPALGYRGVVVENLSSIQPDVQAFSVHRGHSQLLKKQKSHSKSAAAASGQTKPSTGARSDGSVALETRLLNLAHSHGVVDDRLLEHINSKR